MASTYSTNLKIELIGTGDQSGTWGTTTNNNFEFAVEEAITGVGTADFPSDADLTLTLSNTNTTQVPRNLVLNVTSSVSLTTTRSLIVPTVEKQYLVWNNTTGGQSITVTTLTGSGVTIPSGAKAHLMVDATDVVRAFDNVDINSGTIDGVVIGGASAAAGSFTTLSATGNITVGGTVDGRDVAADGTKLDTVETNADVTDTANVTAAGALMDSELTDIAAVKALDQGVATTDSPSFAGLTATTADINGGTIDGATIGGSSAAPGTFTNLEANGTVKLNGNFPTGTNNVALGENALGDASLSGGTNTAIGDNALFSNTTGTGNSALGGNAMYSNLSGQSNAAVGNAALFTNDTGSYNAALGVQALYFNTASYNVAAGYRALYTNSTGADNVAVGYYALYTNSTGGSNVAVGESALTVATGSSNTAVGSGAGSLITTGAKNTIIGAYDGNQGGLDIRTASNYVVLSDGDGNPRAYHNGTLWTFDSLSSTTVDTTNIEVTNLKAKDGTAAGSIADSTGVVTLSSSVLTTTDINGGSVDGVTLGTNNAVTEAQIDNIKIDGNTISSTNTNGNVTITPDGTGSVVISKIDVAGGEIDGTAIGATSASTGNFSTLSIGGTAITATATELNILDGVTATSSELNVLDGITATTTELNYTDGVTSNIQTQLDAKAPLASPTFTGTVTTANLDSDGSIRLDGNYPDGAGNVAVGNAALSSLDAGSPGNCNTAVGALSLCANACGDHNTALGALSLSGNTGSCNTAIGSSAAVSMTTGCSNVAVGHTALRNTTTGCYNVAVGVAALRCNVDGFNNVAVGYEALCKNCNTGVVTCSRNNTAVGYRSLYAAYGGQNTSVGSCAGYSVTSAECNVFLGYRAGRCITTSDNNTIVGHDSFILATGGSNTTLGSLSLGCACLASSFNVAIGTAAGYSMLSGNNNIFIGRNAGRTSCSPLAVVSGSNYVVVGNNDHNCFVATCAWQTSSDCRDKTDIAQTVYGLDFVRALNPVEYKWDKRHRYDGATPDGSKKDTRCSIGFLAQEVLAAERQFAPSRNSIIVSDDDPDHLNLGETRIIPALVRAIQEQQEQIDALKAEIATLKGQ